MELEVRHQIPVRQELLLVQAPLVLHLDHSVLLVPVVQAVPVELEVQLVQPVVAVPQAEQQEA